MTMEERIEKMYRGDVRNAIILVVLLWITILFVLLNVWPFIPLQSIKVAVFIAASILLIFNTAAIAAMLRHYKDDKEFIYSLDIRYLDEIEQRKKGGTA